MTDQMVLIPRHEWEDLLAAADDYIDPEPVEPTTHPFVPYQSRFGELMCGHSNCGASLMNPVHYS